MLWSEHGGVVKCLYSCRSVEQECSVGCRGAVLYLGPWSWEYGPKAREKVTSPKYPVG